MTEKEQISTLGAGGDTSGGSFRRRKRKEFESLPLTTAAVFEATPMVLLPGHSILPVNR